MPRTSKISHEEWERHEATIRTLYLDEDLSLELVMKRLEDEGFQASKSQYTTKLKEWGLKKNQTGDKWFAIARGLKRRAIDYTMASVSINGTLVPPKKLKKELARYNNPSASQAMDVPSPCTPKDVYISSFLTPNTQAPLYIQLPWFEFRDVISGFIMTSISGMLSPIAWTPSMQGQGWYPQGIGSFEHVMSLTYPQEAQVLNTDTATIAPMGQHSQTGEPATENQLFGTLMLQSEIIEIVRNCLILQSHTTRGQGEIESLDGLKIFLPNEGPFNVDDDVQTMIHPKLGDQILVLVSYIAYLASNGLLERRKFDDFVRWLIKNWNEQLFDQVLLSQNLIGRVFLSEIFFSAVRLGDHAAVQFMIQKGVDVNLPSSSNDWIDSYLPLHQAVVSGDEKMVELLLGAGADVNSEASHWDHIHGELITVTPLSLAAECVRHPNLITRLIEEGAKPSGGLLLAKAIVKHATIDKLKVLLQHCAKNSERVLHDLDLFFALCEATSMGDLAMVQLILENGGNPDYCFTHEDHDFMDNIDIDKFDNTYIHYMSPLSIAVHRRDQETTSMLLEYGAGVNYVYAGDPTYQCDMERNLRADYLSDSGISPEPCYCSCQTPLQAATSSSNLEAVIGLLELGANINMSFHTPPLVIAVMRSDLRLVKFLIENKADVNQTAECQSRLSPLVAAAYQGSQRIVQTLLEAGADIDACPDDTLGRSALQIAAEESENAMMSLLIQYGADVNGRSAPDAGITALQAAAKSGNVEGINILLENGADVNAAACQENSKTALQWAVEFGYKDIVAALLQAGADVNAPGAKNSSTMALALAIDRKDPQLIETLLSYGADVNLGGSTSRLGFVGLAKACQQSAVEVVQLLIRHGASLDLPFDEDHSLDFMCSNPRSHADNLMILAILEASMGEKFPRKCFCLAAAIDDRKFELADELIQSGIDVNVWDPSHDQRPPRSLTPLRAAAQAGNLGLCQRLVKCGADVNTPAGKANLSRTCLQAAVEGGYVETVRYLLAIGADVNAPAGPYGGVTALQAASINGYLSIAQLLLEAGADVGAPPSKIEGRTAIDGAIERGRIDMLKLLLESYTGVDLGAVCERAIEFAEQEKQWAAVEILRTYE